MEKRVFQLKVTLCRTKPPIWRRLEVPADTTLGRLHDVVQIAMGWFDCHLHQFVAKGVCYGVPDPEFGPGLENEKKTRLDQVLRKPKDKLTYEYDFGDSWYHDIVLEKVLSASEEKSYPLVTAGRGACPPEDCGGIGGFYGMLEILGDPAHPRHEEVEEWFGNGYDPKAFDLEAVNRAFRGRRKR